MIELTATADGLLLPVLAQPGSRQDRIVGEHDGRLKIAVVQVAEGGQANRKLRQVLAESLGIKRAQVTLHSGGRSARKKFLVTKITWPELQQRIEDCLATR